MITPKKKEKILIMNNIFEFFKPEYLNIWIWLSVNKLMKNSCVEIKKINGNISNIKAGEFNNER